MRIRTYKGMSGMNSDEILWQVDSILKGDGGRDEKRFSLTFGRLQTNPWKDLHFGCQGRTGRCYNGF
jgi:hypothetical protein